MAVWTGEIRGEIFMEEQKLTEYIEENFSYEDLVSFHRWLAKGKLEPALSDIQSQGILLCQQPHPQGDGACDSSSHSWADHNRLIDRSPKF